MIPMDAGAEVNRTGEPDPITLQVIRHELTAIPNQIEKNIERTAFSPLVQEYKDYSVGFVDPEGRLVAQSRGGDAGIVTRPFNTIVPRVIRIRAVAIFLSIGDVYFVGIRNEIGERETIVRDHEVDRPRRHAALREHIG